MSDPFERAAVLARFNNDRKWLEEMVQLFGECSAPGSRKFVRHWPAMISITRCVWRTRSRDRSVTSWLTRLRLRQKR